jgi:gluconate 2-dehydrogenase gamma chain
MKLDRREFLHGTLVSCTALAVYARSTYAGPTAILSRSQRSVLVALSETMIPKTDTPGALEVGVPSIVEGLLVNWASPSTVSQIRQLLTSIDQFAVAAAGAKLAALGPERRVDIVRDFDRQHVGNAESGYPRMKDLILTAYYGSEVGATEELRYQLVPGTWAGCVQIEPGQRAWAVELDSGF